MENKNYTLTDIQKDAVERLKQFSAHIVALSPGCGKTLLILDLISQLLEGNNDKCLFFIPKSARAAFEKEMCNRIKQDYILICAGKNFSYSEMAKHRFIFVENTLVSKYVEDLVSLANTNTCHLVIDEAHSLQNPESVFCKAAWEIRCYCKRIYAMTATPLLNSIEGLFNLYHFVYPRTFVSWFRFRARYCITQEHIIKMKNRNGALIQRKVTEIVGYQNMQELNETLDKLTIKGCVHYNVNFNFLECPLDEQSEKAYRFASNGLFDILYHPEKVKVKGKGKKPTDNISENQKDFGSRVHDLQRCVDGCDTGDNDPGFVSNKTKLLIEQLIKIMSSNESVLVYFEYKDSLEMVERILLDKQQEIGFTKIYRLTGDEKEDTRAKIESNLGLKEIVLCSQAASQSRNLQRANNLILWNVPWSCGRLIQVLGRICRVDTTFDHQNVAFLSVNNTIDEYKIELFKRHINLIKILLGVESVGTLDNCECCYIDVDYSNAKELKKRLLWRRR